MFNLSKNKDNSKIRRGRLKTLHGWIETPFFMPIATKGVVRHLTVQDLKSIGAQIILSNVYHLWQRPGIRLIKKNGGLHKFMNWPYPILTDSGGYQIFSLAKRRKLSPEGVKFISEIDGQEIFLSPEKAVEAQLSLKSDVIMVLDECPHWPCSYQYAQKSLRITLDWAERSKNHFLKLTKRQKNKPLIFGIIQGSVFKDLRLASIKKLLEIGFDGYAIGGVSVGEPKQLKKKILNWVLPFLPQDKPRYLMGIGRPEEIVEAVNSGIDMFDCAIPTREGRHGRLYVLKKNRQNLKSKFYQIIQITNQKYKNDFAPIDQYCSCLLCQSYSRAYLRHLFMINDPLGPRLATIHNLKFYLNLMSLLRKN